MSSQKRHTDFETSAALIVVMDEKDIFLNYYAFLMKYTSIKLKEIGILLAKIFFITRLDYLDIQRQVKHLLDAVNIEWLIITTTNTKNDHLLSRIVVDLNSNNEPSLVDQLSHDITCFQRVCFLIKYQNFTDSFSQAISHIMLNQEWKNIKFIFNCKIQLDNFLELLKNDDNATVSDFKTSYSEFGIEISSKKSLEKTSIGQKFDYFLNNNYLNADYLVYNFSRFTMKEYSNQAEDLIFLANKIDLKLFANKIANSISIIEKTIQQSNSDQTCISLNGGKDCCVVLYLFFACALRMGYQFPLNVLIIKIKNSFTEMEKFIFEELKKFYRDSLEYIVMDDTSKSLKQNLFDLKNKRPHLNYILMGTRRTDADYYKNMTEFAPTDSDWPSFIRVNPILDWAYSEIWYFIRLFKLPYCQLYNRGFTSIDNSLNTQPNSALSNNNNSNEFLPAFFLQDDILERNSRVKNSN